MEMHKVMSYQSRSSFLSDFLFVWADDGKNSFIQATPVVQTVTSSNGSQYTNSQDNNLDANDSFEDADDSHSNVNQGTKKILTMNHKK